MTSIKKILFPTDFSETANNAFRYCLHLADEYGANIILLHIVSPEYQVMDLPVLSSQATQDKAEAAKILLQGFVAATLAQTNETFEQMPNIQTVVEIGEPVSIITDIAEAGAIDLIVMGTSSEHSALEKFFGSISTSVLERVHCSVWIIPENAVYDGIETAAYATDLKDADPSHILKANQLLAPFHPLLHCVHISNNGQDTAMNRAEIERFFAANAPTVAVNFHELQGTSVTDGLEEFSEVNNVDVLIMQASQHTFFERIFYPSETRRMALQSHIPLLLYKESTQG